MGQSLDASAVHGPRQHSSWRRISVAVDDFGLHDGINAAALTLARQGRVQAISAMVGASAWARGAQALKALDASRVDVGLHLDFTECPLNPSLRRPLWKLIAQAYLRCLDAAALRAEIEAQLDAFESAMERPPAYVDGHQHVHQLPMVRDELVRVLTRRYPMHAPWLRATHSPRRQAHADTASHLKSHAIALLGARALSSISRSRGLLQNGRLLGVYGLTGDASGYRDRLERWLQSARDGDLLMCHVGVPDRIPDALALLRQNEFAVLAAADFDVLLMNAHICLLPMSRWLAS
ncbi:MAG: ChbG/HpnK family deacetylase [Acidovorax sp.]|nr:ChbG/HpnK family deacetylase [Acidovorax sp.]